MVRCFDRGPGLFVTCLLLTYETSMWRILTVANRRWVAVVSLFLACSVPSLGVAASFDCGKAKTRFERTVCADPELSAQDAAMGKRYDDALPLLSDAGKAILRTGQEQWLKVVNVLCVVNKRDESPNACLQRQYADRLGNLRSAAVPMGPFVLSRSDAYASTGKETGTGRPFEQHTSVPRIDQPRSPLAEQWNAAMVRWAAAQRVKQCFGDTQTPGDQFLDFKVQSAMPGFINVEMTRIEECDGQAADEELTNVSFLLQPALRPLAAADVFKPGSGWETFLDRRASKALGTDGETLFADGINKRVRDPQAWSFTPDGLLISFNPGDATAIATGLVHVTVPWTD
jgi:uncharacterized protein